MKTGNRRVVNAPLHVAENGCKRRRLPKESGNRHTKIHMIAADDRTAVTFSLSPGQASDGAEGRALRRRGPSVLKDWEDKSEVLPDKPPMAMDKAYEGGETRASVTEGGFTPAVPPKDNRKEPWGHDKALYRRRNQAERLFRKLEGFRRIFTRFEKPGAMFRDFLLPALSYLIL